MLPDHGHFIYDCFTCSVLERTDGEKLSFTSRLEWIYMTHLALTEKIKFYFLNCENLKNVYYINQFITFKTKNIDESIVQVFTIFY